MAFFGVMVLFVPVTSFAGGCGDPSNSGTVNILDIIYLINYVYKGGSPPECDPVFGGIWCGDVNNNNIITILDITYLINYTYKGGPRPVCGCGGITDIDGNLYRTIVIGDQCWMMENLRVTHYRNGDSLPNVTGLEDWEGLSGGAYCNYNNSEDSIAVYGRLYNWYAVNASSDIAPEGWHVPADAEWQSLIDFLGGASVAGGKLKDTGTVHWCSPNIGATNESGFKALPRGLRYAGSFVFGCEIASFWSSTEFGDYYAWCELIANSDSAIERSYYLRNEGFSVRCVKD
jgi:uncharacterized protein (TIGR02145 family)